MANIESYSQQRIQSSNSNSKKSREKEFLIL